MDRNCPTGKRRQNGVFCVLLRVLSVKRGGPGGSCTNGGEHVGKAKSDPQLRGVADAVVQRTGVDADDVPEVPRPRSGGRASSPLRRLSAGRALRGRSPEIPMPGTKRESESRKRRRDACFAFFVCETERMPGKARTAARRALLVRRTAKLPSHPLLPCRDPWWLLRSSWPGERLSQAACEPVAASVTSFQDLCETSKCPAGEDHQEGTAQSAECGTLQGRNICRAEVTIKRPRRNESYNCHPATSRHEGGCVGTAAASRALLLGRQVSTEGGCPTDCTSSIWTVRRCGPPPPPAPRRLSLARFRSECGQAIGPTSSCHLLMLWALQAETNELLRLVNVCN